MYSVRTKRLDIMLPRLSLSLLPELSKNISKPIYNRSQLSAGILHFGIGNFHRAHQAVYLDDLFAKGCDHDWAIIGAGLMPTDAQRRNTLIQQDYLTTVIEISEEGFNSRITGSMIDFCENTPDAIFKNLINPSIRIVTLTVTEGGYYIDPETGSFDYDHKDIQYDARNIQSPKSVFGLILKALVQRKQHGILPFTILSCDNLLSNGASARNAVLGLAEQIKEIDLAWLKNEIAFPNAMVDCITPVTTDKERTFIENSYGFIDEAPVMCEPFRQWVIEDKFPNSRPLFEKVGVEFTSDVHPYEELKLNILNAGHAAIAYPSALLGFTYASEAMADKDISAWLNTLMSREVTPNLKEVSSTTPIEYLQKVHSRFKNPELKDTISRLCHDGENRQPKFIFPSIYRALDLGSPLNGLALEIAFWCLYLAENKVGPKELWENACATKDKPTIFITQSEVFSDLRYNTIFLKCFNEQITRLWSDGVRACLQHYLKS